MIKAILELRELMRQLPDPILDIIAQKHDLVPKHIIVAVTPIREKPEPQAEHPEPYPNLRQIFTQTEYRIFCTLYDAGDFLNPQEIALEAHCSAGSNLAQHICQIRRKIEEHNLPFTLSTWSGHGYRLLI